MPTQDSVRTFHQGKQNRDNDPRVIQDGEYIKLVNGRIARSEGDGVGSIENTLGNELVSTFVDINAVVLGSVRDIAEDKIYYFIKGSEEDAVYEFNEQTGRTEPLLRDDKGILNFSVDHLITGVNIIGQSDPGDDEEENPGNIHSQKLLLWTDNFNPPRKININRIKADLGGGLGGFTEEEISLEKAPPLFSPQVEEVYLDIDTAVAPEAEIDVIIPQEDINKPLVRKREIAQLTIERLTREENLKEKFPRFAYRYRYQDREYSAFSPFSKPMFRPGTFGYDQATGTITGMENQMKAVDISFNTGPREVIEIDLLYKDTMSNAIYVIETYNKADREWGNNIDLSHLQAIEKPIRYASQKLYRALPDSQLLRVYDNVPLRAQAMEIVDNRVMFGNYVDQYDLLDIRKVYDEEGNLTETIEEDIVVDIQARISKPEEVGQAGDSIQPGIGERSLKSDRDYELGIVYLDNLGRQTPVLTSQNNSITIPVDRANRINRASVEINSKAPEFATHYRMFVKDTRSLPHHNIIPLETQVQPDDDSFRWFRLAETDQEKVKEGDYLVLKVNNGSFTYLEEDTDRIQVRVEEVGIRGNNFLEVNPPRIGRIVEGENTDNNNLTAGRVLDEGVEVTVQRAGLWMKTKNISQIPREEAQPAGYTESGSRSNNARNANFRPIKGLPSAEDKWKDMTYYYRGNNVTSETVLEPVSVTFSGTYTPGTELDGYQTGPDGGGHGPMRLEIEIVEGGMFRTSFYLSPSASAPAVIKQTLDDVSIGSSATLLVNGISVAFPLASTAYNIGDRWVTTYRTSYNFMWRCWDPNGARPGGPNNASRYAFNARRSHIMLYGPGVMEKGINGRSMIQFGIKDGLNTALEQDPISLAYNRNQYYTEDVFYDTFEEWMFEEGYWTAGGAKKLAGTARDGENIGIHQFGFYRGLPVTPDNDLDPARLVAALAGGGAIAAGAALTSPAFLLGLAAMNPLFAAPALMVSAILSFAGSKTTENFWRLSSGPSEQLINEAEEASLPLYAFVQSGTRNEGSNNKKANPRQSAEFSFFQGTGVGEDQINMLNIAFETIPEESNQDIYYEIGETFTCLNGVHFSNEMSNSQKITYLDPSGNETFDAFSTVDGNIIPHTETRKVTPITVNLEYHNCFTWNNGIEVKSIRDEIGTPALDSGAKANIVTRNYEESNNFGNIIFSERFDQQTGINGLNEFSSTSASLGRNIKEMDESDGSIQKMFSKDTNLIVFQEDKISQVLVGKDQLLNADGSSNITSSQQVLGQTVAYEGEFGISQNPESFAVYGNRIYFADANRGVILRLGQSGLEEISNFGMRDFFRDELKYRYEDNNGNELPPVVIGSYDDYHDQYIVSVREPINDPSLPRINKPLLISKQAFLSRTDACRYPEDDLQFTQVYEFYTIDEPQGFQVGDLVYYDEARTKIFNGDNDWFVWYDQINELDCTGGTPVQPVADEDLFTQEFTDVIFPDAPLIEQEVSVVNLSNGQVFTGSVAQAAETQTEQFIDTFDTDGNPISVSTGFVTSYTVVVRYDDGTLMADLSAGPHEINSRFKFVIKIDNFGVVRNRVNCVGVLPANYDAVRISIRSYTSPQEACGKGVVTRLVFHDGDDPTPDTGDSIYDTPYGSDEFEDGDYSKGRTQKRGWYKMFDGDDLDDYVINIIQGKVEKKIPCSQIEAGRTRVLTSEFPIQRRMSELERRLATRVCAVLPAEESFHDGENIFPILGDSLFQDNFTPAVLAEGYYAVDGGFYARVNEEGVITFISDCSIKLCYDDVIRARVLKAQNREVNLWRFCGVGDDGLKYPEVSATNAMVESDGSLTFNGHIDDLGEYPIVNSAWYWISVPDDPDTGEPLYIPDERELINDGRRIAGNTEIDMIGPVDEVSRSGFISFSNIFHIFAAEVDNVFITTDVLVSRTLRTVLPTTVIAVSDTTPALGSDITFTSSFDAQAGDNPTGYQWLHNGAFIAGATEETLTITDFEASDNGDYTLETFFAGGLTVVSNTINIQYIIEIITTDFERAVGETDNAAGTMSSDHTLVVTGVPGATYSISVDFGSVSPSTGTIPGVASAMNISDTVNHTWTIPINLLNGVGDQPETDRTATIAVTGATVEHTGDDTVVITQDAGPAIVDGTSAFSGNPISTYVSGGQASGSSSHSFGNYAPAFDTQDMTFTQTRPYVLTTTFSNSQFEAREFCDVVTTSPQFGGVQGPCDNSPDPDVAFGGYRVTATSTVINPDANSNQTETRTVTVTCSTVSDAGYPTTEAALGRDVNGDGDMLDDVDKGVTTCSGQAGAGDVASSPVSLGDGTPVAGDEFVPAGGQKTAVATLAIVNNLTGLTGEVSITGDTAGSTESGAGTPYNWSVIVTPTAGHQIGSAGDGVAVTFSATGTVSGTIENETITITLTGEVAVTAVPIPSGDCTWGDVMSITTIGFFTNCEYTLTCTGAAIGVATVGSTTPGDPSFNQIPAGSTQGTNTVCPGAAPSVFDYPITVCENANGDVVVCDGSTNSIMSATYSSCSGGAFSVPTASSTTTCL